MSEYRFKSAKSWSDTIADLRWLFSKMGVRDYHVTPYADAQRGYPVAIDYGWNGREIKIETAKWDTPALNIRCLYLAIDFLRLNRERGLEDVIQSAYLQLPAPSRQRDPYEVLGVRPDSPIEVIEAAHRALAKRAHPDAGGSTEAMTAINAAMERIKESRR